VVVPPQDAESAQRVPAACTSDRSFHLQWNTFAMKQVERPAPVLVAVLDHDFYCFADATIGPDSRIPQIIEPSQNVVVPERREGEAQPAFVDDFAGSKRAEHAAFEQIIFASFPGARDGGRFAPCSFICEQPFEHTDGGMERRAAA